LLLRSTAVDQGSVPRIESGFLSTTVKLSCKKERDEEKRKTVEKITRKGGPCPSTKV
jgi:hypothetical protein